MTAVEYLKENSDWFDKSPGGEKLYFESEVIKMMENYSSQTEISDEEIFYQKQVMNPYPSTKHLYTAWEKGFMECAKWYREQLKIKQNEINNTKL